MHEKQISDRVKPLAADQPSFWCSYMLVFWQSDLNVGGVVVIAVTLECVMPYESCYRDETSRPFPVGEVVVVLGYTCWGDEWRRLVDASGDLCTALDKIVEHFHRIQDFVWEYRPHCTSYRYQSPPASISDTSLASDDTNSYTIPGRCSLYRFHTVRWFHREVDPRSIFVIHIRC